LNRNITGDGEPSPVCASRTATKAPSVAKVIRIGFTENGNLNNISGSVRTAAVETDISFVDNCVGIQASAAENPFAAIIFDKKFTGIYYYITAAGLIDEGGVGFNTYLSSAVIDLGGRRRSFV
jgi:hypothetical protein